MSSGPIRRFFEYTLTNSRATHEIEVLLGKGVWNLDYHGFERTAGTGATYQPALSETSAETSGSLSERARLNYSATILVAVITRDQLDPGIPYQVNPDASGNGKLYYKPFWNTGTNNAGRVILVFTKSKGSIKSSTEDGT